MGPSIGGPETIYYYQPQGWTEFSVETLHFFTLSFSYSVKANNISSFKWEKDKKWLSLRSLCYQSMSWCQILHILHYSHNWSKLTPKKKKNSLSRQFITASFISSKFGMCVESFVCDLETKQIESCFSSLLVMS